MLRLDSSLRCRAPEETLARAAPLMPGLGISRVTDVTRMDRLGLPVFASIRPRGLALCVHAGKGVCSIDARVGALMEAIEYAAAEPQRSAWRRQTLRIDALEESWSGELHMIDLAPRMGPPAPSKRRLDIVLCEDLGGGRPMALPAELIFAPFDDPHGTTLFGWSTNGLASGNSLAEATLHALLEVLERDALAMNMPQDASCWIDPEDLPEPLCTLAATWRRLGVALALRHVPNDFGLPCFQALLHEGDGARVDMAGGFGLHLDAGIAATRAVCEAAQSRLSHIHGGRDDITRFYAKYDDASRPALDARETMAFQEAFDLQRRMAWADVPSITCGATALEDLLAWLVDRLRRLGFGKVLRHRFDLDLGGLQVVKLVVPRCEEIDGPLSRLGLRLYERVMADG